jgi:small conductance mechanosensitive channel
MDTTLTNAVTVSSPATALQQWGYEYALKIILALVILLVGRWLARVVRNTVTSVMTRRNVDPIIISFATNITYVGLLVFVVVAALRQLGIETASFVAVIGAAGLAIALAFQSSLSNFAAGFLMVMFKPFKKGDYIEGAGTAGIVQAIQVFTTTLLTPDNKLVIVPNGKLMGDNITNFSAKETRRVDLTFGVSYGDNLKRVKDVLQTVVAGDERILKEPAPTIAVSDLGESSVNFVVRIWVKTPDFWAVRWDTVEKVKSTFDREGITIPFPQRVVHTFQKN